MWNLLQIELFKISKRPRTYIAFAAITAIVFIFQFAFKADGQSYMDLMLQSVKDSFELEKTKAINGYFMCYIILNTLLIQVPILVALIAADSISGEANMGTLRLLISKPISRTQLILVKFAAATIFTVLLLLWMAVTALLVSLLIFGADDMLIFRVKGEESQILQITKDDIMWRYYAAFAYASVALTVIAALSLMLSIFAENKRQIKGIIHDESESGKTVYIEPEETVFLNNELFELERAEKREIYKILKTLCNELRLYTHLIIKYQDFIGQCDFMRSKSKLSYLLDAQAPGILSYPAVKLVHAYHPLLKLLHKKNKKETIAHTASINQEQQIILVSGPNAGGKSVTLKTFALLQLMFQSGLHIPADNVSELGIFDQIMADVGDSQSLEDELSTYSSRLRYMKHFVANADAKTLFFIDEFGTGTDPVFGGAMAEAILQEL